MNETPSRVIPDTGTETEPGRRLGLAQRLLRVVDKYD